MNTDKKISCAICVYLCSSVAYVFLVGPGGIEPPTSPLSGVRSSHLSYGPRPTGGAGRDRTGDILNANQALSQLSYSPSVFQSRPVRCRDSGNQSLATLKPFASPQVEM